MPSTSPLILYATETGTAREVSDTIARQCRRIACVCRVRSMDQYSIPELIEEAVIIFVVSTSGSGKEPRSMIPFWSLLLRGDLPPDLFDHLTFAVFGLGDSAYQRFCWPAKRLARRLVGLGAAELCSVGLGDDQHPRGIDGSLEPWCQGLLPMLASVFIPIPVLQPLDLNPPPRASLSTSSTSLSHCYYRGSHTVILKNVQRITASDWYQDVRHFEFQLDEDIHYVPGDAAVIYPEAPASQVDQLLAMLGWSDDADTPLSVQSAQPDQSFPVDIPNVATLRVLFSQYLDFLAVPRRSFFEQLHRFTVDNLERERLDELLENPDDLFDYCFKVKRTIFEVLGEFRHARIPREYIFDAFPFVRPREFSIACSTKKYPHQIHLCIAIVEYRTRLKVPRRGQCTNYLAGLKPGAILHIDISKGLIKLPDGPVTPVICVGPGTGVAPIRAVIQDRLALGFTSNSLYFGCRSAVKDQHYADEWRQLAAHGKLNYRVAFSRDGPPGAPKIYVQDLMREDSAELWQLIGERKGCVIISGSSNQMPMAVRDVIKHAVSLHSAGLDAAQYVEEMERSGRLVEECWS
ncbi:riboflavin synthase domain-like protein [Fistulina hepatica ATCC 64428]|uniref:NADPH-dependent diflavin oxidoreductase 1 n=1 Tax=Fistulina hepatica ATCC 64428 TaxID=1128425 RepID=A0A0D7A365_9AGAR|nr:riboflavin synthase domain-like protein [Fistulina hepatica ATCC 64428]